MTAWDKSPESDSTSLPARRPSAGPAGTCLAVRPAGRLDYPVRETKLTGLWLPPRLPLGQQFPEVLSRPQRVEARILRHLGRFPGPLVDGLAQGSQGTVPVGGGDLLPPARGEAFVLGRQPDAARQQAGGRVRVAGWVHRHLKELAGGLGSGGMLLQLQERLGHPPAVEPVSVAIIGVARV